MAKEMHVGHLRSIVQGEFISRILEKVGGYDVTRISHVGDFGTPIGNIIAHCIQTNQSFHPNDLSSPNELSKLYVEASKKAKEDSTFTEKGLQITLELQKGNDKSIEEKWKRICEISRSGFKEIENWFHVSPTECGESFYKDKLASIVDVLGEKNISRESEGAQIAFIPMGKKEVPFIVQKRDKSYLYATTDLAALQHRTQELQMDKIVYLTDTAQQTHFQQLFYIGEKLNWNVLPNGKSSSWEHAHFGAVLGSDGTRMRSRDGNPVKLQDFLQQAESKAEEALNNSLFNSGKTDIKLVAQASIKFYELSNQRTHNYKFSFDHMMQFNGSTGVYLLYAYSRAVSILEKFYGCDFNTDMLQLNTNIHFVLNHPTEQALGNHLIAFWDILDVSLSKLLSNGLCDYLFTLACKFSKFYEKCPVLTVEDPAPRVELCKATVIILMKGFEILNITPTRL